MLSQNLTKFDDLPRFPRQIQRCNLCRHPRSREISRLLVYTMTIVYRFALFSGFYITSKKREKTDNALNDFVGEIHEYVVAVKEANEELKGISSYFKGQAESNHRKLKTFDEIMELSGFSEQEIIDVGEYILKDTNQVDTFFALSKDFQRTYLAKQLFEATLYRPTFDFQDENGI